MSTISHTTSFVIDQPIDVLFPLFSPEGERLWVPGWDYRNVMGSDILHEDYVFTTQTHDHAGSNAIWIVKRYEPEKHQVQFYRVEPEEKVGLVSVECERKEMKVTKVTVTYKYVALSASGQAFVEGFTESFYEVFIQEWKDLLERYFEEQGR